MPVDIFKNVNFTEGEGLDPADLQALGQWGLARQLDQLLMPQFGDIVKDPFIAVNQSDNLYDLDQLNTPFARTVTAGDAVLMQGSAGDVGKVKVGPGTLLQKTLVAADGNYPTVLAYTVPAAGTDWMTPAAGHATEYRFDIVQMKLEVITDTSTSRDFEDAYTGAKTTTAFNKQRRAQATFSLKQGANAPLSSGVVASVIPSPDAGYAVVGVIFIQPTWTTAQGYNVDGKYPVSGSAAAWLFQGSYPLGMRSHTVYAHQFNYGAVTNWALNTDVALSSGVASGLKVFCPSAMGRIVGVSIQGAIASGTLTGSLADCLASATNANTNTTWFTGIDGLGVGGPGASKFTPIYNLGLKLPLWGQSGGAGPIERRAQSAFTTTPLRGALLILAASANNCRVSSVTFHMAG